VSTRTVTGSWSHHGALTNLGAAAPGDSNGTDDQVRIAPGLRWYRVESTVEWLPKMPESSAQAL